MVELVRGWQERGVRLVEFDIRDPRALFEAFPDIDGGCWQRANTQTDNIKLSSMKL